MSGFQRSTLYPPSVPRHAGIDQSELDWRNEIRDKTQKMICPPVVPVPPLDTGMAKFVAFWNLPAEQRESILAAEAEHREQAERERLEAARQAELERLGVASALEGIELDEPMPQELEGVALDPAALEPKKPKKTRLGWAKGLRP